MVSIGALFATIVTVALGEVENVDAVLGVELEEDKLAVTS